MIIPYSSKHILGLSIALSCYSSTFLAAEAVQDPGDDGWYGLAPIDVNPSPKNVNFGAPTPITTDGKTITATPQSWAGANTQDLGVQTLTTTVNGSPVMTAMTQYAQLVEATTTSDGKATVATNMVVSPKMLDVLRKTADKAISACNAKRKRSNTCTLTQIGEQELRSTLEVVAKEQTIEIGSKTIAALTAVFLLGGGANLYHNDQFEQPVTVPITDAPSATSSSSSSAGPTVTAWIDPPYPDLDSILKLDIKPTGPIPTASDDMHSTSLFCSATATPSPTIIVDRRPAISHGEQFCHDIAGSIFGLGQPYNGTQEQYEGKFAYFTDWATTEQCKDKSITYTIDENSCKRYIYEIVDRCDPPAPDNGNEKYGGTVTDGCMIFELQPYQMQTGAPARSSSPTTAAPSPSPTKPCPDLKTPLGQIPCDTACPGGQWDTCGNGKSMGISGVSSICLCKDPCHKSWCWNPAVKIGKRSGLLDKRYALSSASHLVGAQGR